MKTRRPARALRLLFLLRVPGASAQQNAATLRLPKKPELALSNVLHDVLARN